MSISIAIYEIRFETGHFYIGQTRERLATRLSGHKSNHKKGRNTNRRMSEMFAAGIAHSIYEVARFDNERDADIDESERIHIGIRDHGADCLNRQAGPIKGVLNGEEIRERAKQTYKLLRCSWCRQYKSWLDFRVDNHRSSGFHSRCNQCSSFISACYTTCRDTKKGYALAKRIFDLNPDVSRAAENEYLSICKERNLTPYPALPPAGGGGLPRKRFPGNVNTPIGLADKARLRELFIVQGLTPFEIAKKVNTTHTVVCKYLRLHGFRKRAGYRWQRSKP